MTVSFTQRGIMAKKDEISNAAIANTAISAELFEVDSDLLSEEFNCLRMPRLPYAVVINDNPAGIFIPEANLVKAAWEPMPELVEVELTSGKEKGILLTSVRMIVLGHVPVYLRYKKDTQIEGTDVGLSVVGTYNKELHDKKLMDATSEHLVMFLNAQNQLFHQRPFTMRFRNVALWSFREAIDDFYTSMELTFAKLAQTRASGKSDRWRSLCVFEAQFQAVKEGEGSNKSWCCKVNSYIRPNATNFGNLFLGTKELTNVKNQIWQAFDMNMGFIKSRSLPGSTIDVPALPEGLM